MNGRMIAGFAMVRYPLNTGKAAVMTFIVSYNGKVYQKDLGKKSTKSARMTTLISVRDGRRRRVKHFERMHMKRTNTQIRTLRAMVAGTLVAAGALAGAPASAGGLLLYEIGTEDVGLASAGYTARAQDASQPFSRILPA